MIHNVFTLDPMTACHTYKGKQYTTRKSNQGRRWYWAVLFTCFSGSANDHIRAKHAAMEAIEDMLIADLLS